MSDTPRTEDLDSAGNAGFGNRAPTRLAWSLWAACVALMALALLLEFLTYDPTDIMGIEGWIPGIAVPLGILSLVYPAMGALIVSRLPRNPIGWLFCGVGLLYAVRRFVQAYAEYTLYGNIAFPLGDYAGWLASLLEFTGQALAIVFLMLLFPDGRLLSRRWRIVVGLAICGAALAALSEAFAPNDGNPFGIVGVIGGLLTTYELFAATYCLGMTLLLASSLAALFSLILRLRRARGDERQQLMWFLYAAVPAAAGLSAVIFQFIVFRFTTDLLFSTIRVPSPWISFFMDVQYASLIALLALKVHQRYEWTYLYAFARPKSGEVHWLILPTVNAEVFSVALEHFAGEVGAGTRKRILLVLDGAGWHTAKRKLRVPEGIHLEFLPSHSPELMPAERLWPLSNEGVSNRYFEEIEELEEALVERCVALLDQPELIRSYIRYHWWPEAA